jgi:hypothetical protein
MLGIAMHGESAERYDQLQQDQVVFDKLLSAILQCGRRSVGKTVRIDPIVDLLSRSRLPTAYQARDFVEAGGLMAYAVPSRRTFPSSSRKFELVIDLKTAKVLGLTIPLAPPAGGSGDRGDRSPRAGRTGVTSSGWIEASSSASWLASSLRRSLPRRDADRSAPECHEAAPRDF